MPRTTTHDSRLKCARHAVTVLRTWEDPGEGADWTPSPEQIEAKTASLYPWVRLEPGEGARALEQVLAEQGAQTAAQRLEKARRAVTELLEQNPDATAGWTPTVAQIQARTTELYAWVELTEDEAAEALAQILAMQDAANSEIRLEFARRAVESLFALKRTRRPGWTPALGRIEAETTALNRWITLQPGEAAEALARVLASRTAPPAA